MAEFTVAAYGVIENDRRELLLTRRRGANEWVLPGGTLEEGEPPWDALVREVREETGLEVDLERLIGIYAKKREGDLVFTFRARITGGDLRESDERDALGFFPHSELPRETGARDRERIADALVASERAVLRVQPSQGERPPPGMR